MDDHQHTIADLYNAVGGVGPNDYFSGPGVPLGVVGGQPLRKVENMDAPIHVHPQYYSVMHTHSAFTPPHMLHMQPHVYATVSRERTSNTRGHDDDQMAGGDGSAADLQHYLVPAFHPYPISPGGEPLHSPTEPVMMLTEEQAMEVDAARALEELAGVGRMQQQRSTSSLPDGNPGRDSHDSPRRDGSPPNLNNNNAGVKSKSGPARSRTQSSQSILTPPFSIAENGSSDPPLPGGDSSGDEDDEDAEIESRTTGLDNPFPASCSRPSSTSYYRTAEERAAATPRPQRPRKSRTGVPVPVPHLTKPSRGRRVPVADGSGGDNPNPNLQVDESVASPVSPRSGRTSPYGARTNSSRKAVQPQAVVTPSVTAADVEAKIAASARAYVCQVAGCGKAFRRGEHLKRHVRSLHTHDKPERCTFPGCGKEFSRKDNMQQHLKIHTHNRAATTTIPDDETSEEPDADADADAEEDDVQPEEES